jgi:hypothetical protein
MATYKSSSINRLGYPRGTGVYAVRDSGVIVVSSNVTIGSGAPDTLQICYIPPNSYMSDFKFMFPAGLDGGGTLVLKLVDTLTTTTTYIASITTTITSAGGIVVMAQSSGVAVADGATWGSMYGNTARSIGASGLPVKVWASGAILQFTAVTSGTNTTGASALNIGYMVEWSPAYDEGV